MYVKSILTFRFVFVILVIAVLAQSVFAEVLYVDSTNGDDAHAGTKDNSVRTIARAMAIVNDNNVIKEGTIKLKKALVTPEALSVVQPRGYLHVVPRTLGSVLGAGLFRK